MFRNFIESIFSKGFTSISNFLTVILTAQFLGAEGRGELTLILLAVTIVGLIQNLAGGSAISFYVGKMSHATIAVIAVVWLVITAICVPWVLNYFLLSPEAWLVNIILLSILLGGISIVQSFLLGLEKIRQLNFLEILKATLLVLFIAIHFFVVKEVSLLAVMHAYVLAYGISFLIALFMIIKHIQFDIVESFWTNSTLLFKTGFELQVNNILQLVNYRFTFFIIEKYWGLSALGLVSVTVSLGEALWIICKSAATVLYARLLNEKETKRKVALTVDFTKLSYLLTIIATLILILIPSSIYQFLFGKDFDGITSLLIVYSPSIVFLAFFTILNHYFTATNQNKINIIATFIGNVLIVVLGFIFIPSQGILMSGIVISAAYLVMLIFLSSIFCLQTKTPFVDFFTNFGKLRAIKHVD
jgi:O-antigen/teichoic acid export membrane protein